MGKAGLFKAEVRQDGLASSAKIHSILTTRFTRRLSLG